MIINCEKCSSRLQIDEAKITSRPLTVRCPKCGNSMDAGSSPAVEQSATSVGGSPSTEDPRLEQPSPAPLFELNLDERQPASGTSAVEKLAELLSGLMSQPNVAGYGSQNVRASWNPRTALVCVTEENRETVARCLAENNYQVFVAEDTKQAVDRMRENLLDVVLLDPRFDPVEQGPVFVSREVNVLRPAQRRRLFFVLLSPSLRTMDTHAAFLNNVNAVINVNDVQEVPQFLEQRMRAFNELYKNFNTALGAQAL